MNRSTEEWVNPFVRAYSLVRRSGFLRTSLGRRLFKSAYFLYKRYLEDDLQDLLRAFPDLVAEGNVLDIGANIGYTAALLARYIKPNRKVFAFEPEPFNFGILQQMALQSEFKGKIVPMRCAVGAEIGTIDLWINLRHHADHRVITEQFHSDHPGSTGISTPLVSVDSFLQNQEGSVSFIKIDVQGYELAVCQGMRDTLRQNPDLSIFLEFMPSAMRELGFDPSHLIDFFLERDFEIYLVHRRGQLSQGMPPVVNDSSYFNLLFSRRALARDAKHGDEARGDKHED
ncbi:MAG: FkbM family methyltransferase [Candidatus Acidiferrum sp.]|jgi:FkbM family methyltransferase